MQSNHHIFRIKICKNASFVGKGIIKNKNQSIYYQSNKNQSLCGDCESKQESSLITDKPSLSTQRADATPRQKSIGYWSVVLLSGHIL